MTAESVTWFTGQFVVGAAMIPLGRRVAGMRPPAWRTVAVIATSVAMLWPLMRWKPSLFLSFLGTRIVMYTEVTGMIPPLMLLFAIGGQHHRKPSERRLTSWLIVVCALYFVRSGLWMVRPEIPDLGETAMNDGVCLQSTGYTCVAASMVTLLNAYGIEATETEMARLSHTEVGNGATDSRAIRALERKLADRPFEIHYEVMDYDRLQEVDLPCIVSTKFGYFVSHMVPVLSADTDTVVLGDPLTGRRKLTVPEFLDIWHESGIYVRRCEGG